LLFVQIDFTGTKQIADALCPLLKAIDSLVHKKILTLLLKNLAKAKTVKEKGEWVELIESEFSQALCHPVTFKQHSAVTRFISMLHMGSTSTVKKAMALVAEHKVQEMGQDHGGAPISTNDDSEDTVSPVHIDNLGPDSDQLSSFIASDPSDQSAMSTES
jgi:hypothetical protein